MDEADEALRRTSDEGLLKTFAALTHRMHAAEARLRSLDDRMAGAAVGAVAGLRQQRDRVQDEILRRMRDE